MRFLHRVTLPQFFLERIVLYHTIRKPNPSFRESLYYSTMHDGYTELAMLLIQQVFAAWISITVFVFIYTTTTTVRQYNWGLVPKSDAFFGKSVGQATGLFLVGSFVVMCLFNGVGFGTRTAWMEWDRSSFEFKFWAYPFWRVGALNIENTYLETRPVTIAMFLEAEP